MVLAEASVPYVQALFSSSGKNMPVAVAMDCV